jgi:hypothetical protein
LLDHLDGIPIPPEYQVISFIQRIKPIKYVHTGSPLSFMMTFKGAPRAMVMGFNVLVLSMTFALVINSAAPEIGLVGLDGMAISRIMEFVLIR